MERYPGEGIASHECVLVGSQWHCSWRANASQRHRRVGESLALEQENTMRTKQNNIDDDQQVEVEAPFNF